MEVGWRNDVGSHAVKYCDITGIATSRLINDFKWNYDYFDHDYTDQLQIVPEIHKEEEEEEEEWKKELFATVPDEHSETGDSSNNQSYLRNKHDRQKRRRIHYMSDEESESREVPSMAGGGSKRRRRDEMSDKIRTLQQLIPNCHKTDEVWVLDKAIEYMKNLQLQLQMMSVMGINPYLQFGRQNHLMGVVNQTTTSTLIPPWPFTTNLSFLQSSHQSLFPTTSPCFPLCLYGFVPCFPSFLDFM